MKKRIIALLLISALCLTMFAACGTEIHSCNFGKWKVDEEATCKEEGVEVRKCDCGKKEKRSIEKLDHDYSSKVTTEPTCTAEGVKTYTCSGCNGTYTEAIAKIDHSYSSQVTTEASCTSDGVNTFTCGGCGNTYTEAIPKGEHNYSGTVTTEASCQGDGVTTYTCPGCSGSYTEAIIYPSYSSTELPVMFENSVGEVTTYDKSGNIFSLGTCFVFSADGKLITNYHVIEDSYSATVALAGKTYTVEQVLAYDKDIDIAVLKINATGLTAPTICSQIHRTGETVYAIGSSQGLTATFSNGMITTSQRTIDGVLYVQHDAPISSGNSGGPLINIYGEVIGINTWTVRESQNLNFAIHTSELANLDYSTPMTMAQVYEKESDPFKNMAAYIATYGTYDYTYENYSVTLDNLYSSDYTSMYTLMAYYYPDDNEITLDFLIDNGEFWIYVTLDASLSGYYRWDFFEIDGDASMYGNLTATYFTQNSSLSCSNYSSISYYDLSSYENLATSMLQYYLLYFNTYFAAAGVSLADIGFLYY